MLFLRVIDPDLPSRGFVLLYNACAAPALVIERMSALLFAYSSFEKRLTSQLTLTASIFVANTSAHKLYDPGVLQFWIIIPTHDIPHGTREKVNEGHFARARRV